MMIQLDDAVIAVGKVNAGARIIVNGGRPGQAVGRPERVDQRQRERVYRHAIVGHNLSGRRNPCT